MYMEQIIPFSTGMLETGFFNVINVRTKQVFPNHEYIHIYCYQDCVEVDFPGYQSISCSKIGDDGKYKLKLRQDIDFSEWYQTSIFPDGDRIILECMLADGQYVLTLYKSDTKQIIVLNTFWGNRGPKFKVIEPKDIVYWRIIGNQV